MRQTTKLPETRGVTMLIVSSIGIFFLLAVLGIMASLLVPSVAFAFLPIVAAVQSDLDKFLSDRQLARRFEVGRSTIWDWVKRGIFPKPISLGPRTTRWRSGDVERYLQERATVSTRENVEG